jgi:hypothetical protein
MNKDRWSIILMGAVTAFLSVTTGSDREVVTSELETTGFMLKKLKR